MHRRSISTPTRRRSARPARARRARPPAREALLAAAAELFGAHGPAAVSTRAVAARAKVNNGLIHRHFGTKDELLNQTLARLAGEIAAASPAAAADDDVGDLLRYFEATRERASYWRLLARCLLDGVPMERLQDEFPTIRQLVERLARLRERGAIGTDVDPRVLGAVLAALGLGWLVFEPFLRRSANLEAEEDRERFAREARVVIAKLLR